MEKIYELFPDRISSVLRKILTKETILYLVFGVLTTVVALASYILIVGIMAKGQVPSTLQINIANLISWILAVAFAFITNKIWVFESKVMSFAGLLKEISSFVGARLFSLGFELVWMNVFIFLFGERYDKIYKIGALFGVVVMNYFFSKLFIFKKKSDRNDVSES